MQKATLKNWRIYRCADGAMLMGRAYGHPRFEDGKFIMTSKVKSVDFESGKAITQNTEYTLEP